MKKNDKNSTKKQNKGQRFFIISIYIQLILTAALIIFGIVALFKRELFIWFQLLLGITILDMGINNQLFYKRKNITFLYIGIAIAILVLFFLRLLGW